MQTPIQDYEKQVYAAVLGKTIGVYMGRPFEGWWKGSIEEKWGSVDRYVNGDVGKPLVVADDDISGTFTFVKALSDWSGDVRNVDPAFFGETWRNYLIEGRTILWWGGVSLSTEHTAWTRLKQGIQSPESGSMKRNGKTVSEQIGAQIFIDAFGMVCPGDPDLAEKFADGAARVSHDGEAVLAAKVVARMVAVAFVEKDMEKVLDIGEATLPPDSLIAHVHRDVRAWSREDGDWRKTYDRIFEKYGYGKYGGNCHVIPNHALMVMAWSYAGGDFHEAQRIVNTAGWDTDCNAANVGTVSALVAGLDHICDRYDFRSPFADRLIIPTADGTDSVTDCLRVARRIAALGRRIMGWEPLPPPVALHSFEQPGSLHGWMAEGNAQCTMHNAECGGGSGDAGTARALCVRFSGSCRISTPVSVTAGSSGSYSTPNAPWLYRGMTATICGVAGEDIPANATLRAFVRHSDGSVSRGESLALVAGKPFALRWTIDGPDVSCYAIVDFGLEIDVPDGAKGALFVRSADYQGVVSLDYDDLRDSWSSKKWGDRVDGWIDGMDREFGAFSDDKESQRRFGSDGSPCVFVTGNRSWGDQRLACRFNVHAADRAGVVLRWQGMRRHYAFLFEKKRVVLVRQNYGETVLAEKPFVIAENEMADLEARAEGNRLSLYLNGEVLLKAEDGMFATGGLGFFTQLGVIGVAKPTVRATVACG